MSRILLGLFVVALTASVSSQANPSASQTTSRPGGVAGTATPGQPPAPPRDTPAQQPTTGTARISGRVVRATGNTPLRRAQVWLTPSENPPQFRRTVFTDAQGGYEFRDLPAGK